MENMSTFKSYQELADMDVILARFSEWGLESKLNNQNIKVSECNSADKLFDLLFENEEIEVFRTLFTPVEFDRLWRTRYMIESLGCKYADEEAMDKQVLPKLKKLLLIRHEVLT